MKIYNITHGADMDGMGSAALLVRFFKIPLSQVFFADYDGKMLDDNVALIKKIPGRGNLLIISDFGMNERNVQKIRDALHIFKTKGNYVIWLDHHPWTEQEVEQLAPVCDILVNGEIELCGTDLVYEMLCPHDKYSDELVRITHAGDFVDTCVFRHKYCRLKNGRKFTKPMNEWKVWSKGDRALVDKLSHVIKYLGGGDNIANPKLRKFVDVVAHGGLHSKFIDDVNKQYLKETRPYLKKLLKTVVVKDVKGMRVAIGFSTKINNQEACITMQKQFRAPIAIYINEKSGHSSVRSDVGIDSSAISRAMHGGGHPQASGFGVKEKLTKNEKTALIEKLVTLAKKGVKKEKR